MACNSTIAWFQLHQSIVTAYKLSSSDKTDIEFSGYEIRLQQQLVHNSKRIGFSNAKQVKCILGLKSGDLEVAKDNSFITT